MHWWDAQLDAVQPTSAEHQQVGAALVCHCSPAALTTRIGPDTIILSTAVRDLGIYINTDLSMQTHVQRSVTGCFAVLHQLHSIRRFVPSSLYQSLVVSLVLSRLDYGNVTVAGLPACLLNRLQSVLNLAARSITGLRCSEHITDASEHITDALASFHSAPSTWAHHVQTGGHCLLSSSQHCTSVLVRSAAACRWSADETSRPAAFVNFQSSRRPPIAACYCQQSLFCCCWPTTLEQSTCRRPVCPITRNILSETENAFISAIIPDIVL